MKRDLIAVLVTVAAMATVIFASFFHTPVKPEPKQYSLADFCQGNANWIMHKRICQ